MAQRVLKGPLAANWSVDEGPPLRCTGIDTREVVLVVDQWSPYPEDQAVPLEDPRCDAYPLGDRRDAGLRREEKEEEEEEEEEECSHAIDSTSTKRTKEETHPIHLLASCLLLFSSSWLPVCSSSPPPGFLSATLLLLLASCLLLRSSSWLLF
ncbi:hypothetical protein EYF80_057111 [Liparis tanakae]|uniref:Uncharacterized protein n=1 Tax=Liparis tanakae TaxID=230148 RepID=A0A4Z2EWI9_9TELE|nr:hypothetical protein EYF80_057111 [Liparis tanakae]